MRYPYCKYADETEVVFSHIMKNENGEEIIHISKGKPTPNSTKVWLTKSGGCILANNKIKITSKELTELLESVNNNYFYIISE